MGVIFSRMFPRLLVSTGILLGVAVGGTVYLVRGLEQRVRSQVDLTARLFSSLLTLPGGEAFPADLMDEVLSRLDFPIVITTPEGTPQAWRNVPGLPDTPVAVPFDSLSREEQQHVLAVIREALRSGRYVHLSVEGFHLGTLFFTPPPLLRVARMLPYVLVVVGVLSLVGMAWSAHTLSEAYARELWALFAKGLAHQMGTPISSLMGWLEHLRESPQQLEDILDEMEKDLEDLRDISLRFSRIGQPPAFQEIALDRAFREWVHRWQRRWLRDVDVHLDVKPVRVRGDEILLRWAVENLVKNAYEACGRPCRIWITLREERGRAWIRVVDEGPGIPEKVQRHLFKVRISTKPRGWGMGLWVARKIVEDWHGGKIRLVDTRPGHTEFEIQLEAQAG